MYKFSNNIRIRTFDELSFLVDITNNTFFVLKTKTLKFLELKLKEGLTTEKLNIFDHSFITFIKELEKQNILEVSLDEI
jgi:predicted nucleic-acid-binding Zn-ribbon protein